ncbi:hypothetical protein BOX15_Mlig018572g2 [Macrostomum lignano]|uniref:Histone-lysine N-methyltransferase n=1 Tax=Macrostomum lignano TaxID=282301 RepID=A0A267EDI7_9PLAT|nr:hypothetical protein BOX15_Mlig018572g2 [Macrostomum lignano]
MSGLCHVRFFGSVAETSWVPDDCNLIPFHSKSPKHFCIPGRIRPLWKAACKQAAAAAAAAANNSASAAAVAPAGEGDGEDSDALFDSVFDAVLAGAGGGGGRRCGQEPEDQSGPPLEFHRLSLAPRGVVRPAPNVCDVCEREAGDAAADSSGADSNEDAASEDGGGDATAVAACPNRCGRIGHSRCLASVCEGGACGSCTKGLPVRCFLCNSTAIPNGTVSDGDDGKAAVSRCRVRGCGRVYHTACVASVGGDSGTASGFRRTGRGSTGDGGGGLVCPQHECLTCRLGPPDQAIGSCNGIRLRLLRCVRCPAAYHAGQRCLPAGSRLLGSGKGYIVCPAHSKVGDPSTLDRCLACCQSGGEESDGSSAAVAENGSAKPSCGSSRRKSSNVASSTPSPPPQPPLLRCLRCPAAYHLACLPNGLEPVTAGNFVCSDCRPLGRLPPRYGDIVWAKLPASPDSWWPAELLHPNSQAAAATAAPSSAVVEEFGFSVRLFGDESSDFSDLPGVPAEGVLWITRSQVLDFDLAEACLGGDSGSDDQGDDKVAVLRRQAVQLARAARDSLRSARIRAADAALLPRQYRRRPAAADNGFDNSSSSTTTSDDEDDNNSNAAGRRLIKQQQPRRPPPFKLIKVNFPIGNARLIKPDVADLPRCECDPNSANPCGSDANCLNRALSYECHPSVCLAGERCQNRRFVTRAYPPQQVFRTSDGRGWGLRACAAIAKGDFVNEYVGDLIDPDEAQRRLEAASAAGVREFYMLTLDKQRVIDAGPRGNISRFLNHSCDPNLQACKWSVGGDLRIGLFALRDISPGEELTFNYRFQWFGDDGNGERQLACRCGAKNCAGFLGGAPEQPLPVASAGAAGPGVGGKRPRGRPRLHPVSGPPRSLSMTSSTSTTATEKMETGDGDGSTSTPNNAGSFGRGGWRRGRGVWRRGRGRGRGRGRPRGSLSNGWGGGGGGGGGSSSGALRLAHENECFRCGDGGRLILCSKESCPKAYHADCLGLAKAPFGRWICPWHHCDDCGGPSSRLCSACTASYCDQHAHGRFVQSADDGTDGDGEDGGSLLCLDHSKDDIDKMDAGNGEAGEQQGSCGEAATVADSSSGKENCQ